MEAGGGSWENGGEEMRDNVFTDSQHVQTKPVAAAKTPRAQFAAGGRGCHDALDHLHARSKLATVHGNATTNHTITSVSTQLGTILHSNPFPAYQSVHTHVKLPSVSTQSANSCRRDLSVRSRLTACAASACRSRMHLDTALCCACWDLPGTMAMSRQSTPFKRKAAGGIT